eukprot:SAG11_NODE_142_length_14906_cov_8.352333_20_plen_60_part_00
MRPTTLPSWPICTTYQLSSSPEETATAANSQSARSILQTLKFPTAQEAVLGPKIVVSGG